jgi:hypothetical protein
MIERMPKALTLSLYSKSEGQEALQPDSSRAEVVRQMRVDKTLNNMVIGVLGRSLLYFYQLVMMCVLCSVVQCYLPPSLVSMSWDDQR